ncbi:YfzA family protein [Paucisalibacillus globulus]|uniref:YfzA family protein n=1 Tax=Paucisalibacillus globulus TaxID=351095 RepID=UPI000687B616|nr:YfzA family protein [Paucisalibacillus globulus]
MSINENKSRTQTALKSYGWYIHLLTFVIVQVLFFVFDDVTGWKNIFNLNDVGEWAISKLSPIWEWFHVYNKPQFNLITVIWGLILIIDGFLRIILWNKKKNSA